MGVAMPTDLWRHLDLVGAPAEQKALWKDLDIAERLSCETGFDISIFNDGNAACWAELVAIARPRPADFIYLLISSYIGAGIIGQGTLWEGSTGHSANLGAMLVNDGSDHPELVQFVASISALQDRLEAAGRPRPTGSPQSWNWPGFEPVLGEWIETSAPALARVIFNTMAVTECRLAIVDGIMPRPIVERLTARIGAHLGRLPMAFFEAPQVTAGHLGGLAPAIGAAELPLYRRYFSRTMADIAG
jgi:predicted NBD/HSP70 family sugar kinase